MIDTLLKFLKALNSDSGPWQVAIALGAGMITGLTPFWSFHNLVILLLVCIFRIHFASFTVSFVAFSSVAWLLDSQMLQLGEYLLGSPDLNGLWTTLYQSEFWRSVRFNNTLVLGSFCTGLILFLPLVFISRLLIVQYRERVLAWVRKLKIVQLIQTSQLYAAYRRIAD